MGRTLLNVSIAIVVGCLLLTCNAQAHPPWGIVVDRQGQVYFSDLETIWKLDARGKLSVIRTGVTGRHTHELTIDEEGNLFGEEQTYQPATQRYLSALWKITPAGNFNYVLAPTDDPPKGMSIWRDRQGNMYSAVWKSNAEHDTMIFQRTPDGRVNTLLGNAEIARRFHQAVLYSIGGMSFAEDGTLYIADGPNVRKVTTDGAVTTVASNIMWESPSNDSEGRSAVTRLLGLAVDAQGDVFVADTDNRRILKITHDDKTTTLVCAEQSWSPSGVALRNGDLYILEFGFTPPSKTDGVRVRKLSSDGKIITIAAIGENGNSPPSKNSARKKIRPIALKLLISMAIGSIVLMIVIYFVRSKMLAHHS